MSSSRKTRGGVWVLAQNLVMMAALVAAPLRCCDWPAKWSNLPGIFFMIFGAVFGIAGVRALGRNLTPFPRPRDDAQLVQRGIYSIVRHPLYTSVLLVSIGWTLFWRSLVAVIIVVLLFVILDAKSRLEERWLREKFSEYASYAKRVGRFLPWIY